MKRYSCRLGSTIWQWLKVVTLGLFVTLWIALCLPATAHATESPIQFEHITADQGLSQSGVMCILQDSQGFIWFGTQDGLNKYDGYNFTVYQYDDANPFSLSDNFIASIYEDSVGNLWVGTDSGGLNKFNYKTEQFSHYIHDPSNPNSVGSNRISSIYEDATGTLWVGTDGGGLNQFNRQTEHFTRYTYDPNNANSLGSNTVFSIYEDSKGNLWIGTDGGGLNKFNRQTGQFTRYTHNPDKPHSISNNTVLAIYEDQSSRLWIGTKEGGLNQFNRQTKQFIHYTPDQANSNSLSYDTVSAIAEDKFGNLWLGTSSWYANSYGTGFDKFAPESGQFTHYLPNPANPKSLNDNIVGPLFIDKSEILWIGTAFGGVNKLDQKNQKFTPYQANPGNSNSLSDNHIMSIEEDCSGTVWIGTAYGGLNKFDRQTGKFTHYQHDPNDPNSLSSDTVWSIYEDHLGTLWIGTFNGGLNKFNRETGTFTHYRHNPHNPNSLSNNTITSIYEDHFGTLWIGTFNGGLNKFNRKTGQFTHYKHDSTNPNSLSDNTIWSIYEDHTGTLWIGDFGQGGLNRFNRTTEEFTHYKHDPNDPNSLSYDHIDAIYEDKSGTLWIGTSGGGLNKFDRNTETFTHYTERDGLPSNAVVGIVEDSNGNLWLSTGKGLSKFNPQTETFRNYDVGDGLQGNEFDGLKAYLKTHDGEIFFGGLNGFNTFYPEHVKDNPHVPPIVITDFKVFDKSTKLNTAISEAQELKLSYKENFFSFEFAALDYTNPQKNHYAYKLEGFDKDWIYSGTRRYASYTNLDGGTYIFRVKGTNNDGIWNEEGTALKIIITPPPWKTWWAYNLYILLLMSTVYAYVQGKTQAQAKENALLRDSEHKLHQFLEAIPLGIGVIDTTGKPVYFNRTALQIIDQSAPPQAPLESYSEAYQLYHSETKQLYPWQNLPLVQALRGEKTTIDNLELHHSERIIPLEAWGTPIYNEHNTIIYAIATFQDITERKLAEASLRASLREKEVLLQEVHHRVKNNLQVISSLLDLQAFEIQDPQVKEVFCASQNRIHSMALVHEELYQSQELARIDLAHYIYELIVHLLQTYALYPDTITLKFDLDNIYSSLDIAIPCGLILNELIANAFKHALNNKKKGTLWIELKSNDDRITLIVGNDNSKPSKLINFNSNNSLGLQLVELLVKQLDGKLDIEQNYGTVFKISFVAPS